VFQVTNNPQHAEILAKHSVIVEVMEKLKAIAFQYVALLSVHRGNFRRPSHNKRSINDRINFI
jgi:hypothetical protein